MFFKQQVLVGLAILIIGAEGKIKILLVAEL